MKYEKHVVIVLKKELLDKTVSLVTLFSKQTGKIETRIKGAQHIKGKRLAALEVGSIAEVELYEISPGRTVITSMSLLVALRHPHDIDLEGITSLFIVLEALLYLLPIQKSEEKIFMKTVDVLTKISHVLPEKIIQLRCAFLLQLLADLGYVSQLDTCSHCHRHLRSAEKIFLHPFENRFVCDSCVQIQSSVVCTKDVVKICFFFIEYTLDEVLKLALSREQLIPVEYVIKQFINNTAGRPLESFSL